MNNTIIIRDVELWYAHLIKSHSPFGDEVWDVQVRATNEDTIKQLQEAGVNMKPHKDGYYQANVKRRTKNRNGEPNKPVSIVDEKKAPWDPEVLIGHGTKGNIKLFTYNWEQMGRKGKSAMLSAVQITDLVEYKGNDSVDFDDESGGDF